MASVEKKLFSSANQYIQIMRLDRPIGIYLLLWPTLWGLWLASRGLPDIRILVIFILGVVVMRSAGCVINDIADRDIDPLVERTKQRPLATGAITLNQAWMLFLLLVVVAFMLVLQLNFFTILLSGGGLLLTIIYPFCKRFLSAPQLVLGLAFSWGVPMAFAATDRDISLLVYILWGSVAFWILLYDTFYAMADREEDLALNLNSTAILFGSNDKLMIGLLQAAMLSCLIVVGLLFELTLYYYLSLVFSCCMFLRQHYLIRNREPEGCFKAFLENNYLGGVVFVGIVLSFL
jgi:4-hydroxybenzoate polyprenyltransferase